MHQQLWGMRTKKKRLNTTGLRDELPLPAQTLRSGGSNPTHGMGDVVCLFCVVVRKVETLGRAELQSPVSYCLCTGSRKVVKAQQRAVEPMIIPTSRSNETSTGRDLRLCTEALTMITTEMVITATTIRI
jgi:hypothetical protein